MTKSKQKQMDEVKLNEVMREFNFTFYKTSNEHYDYYEFPLPNSFYIVFIDEKENKINFKGISGDTIFFTKSFKSLKSLRNQLCLAI